MSTAAASKKRERYVFRANAFVTGVTAEVAGRELERIRKANDALTPEAVIEDATPATSPLHPAFEWDDTKAAHQFRLDRARKLIRAVCVACEPQEPPRPKYVHVLIGDQRSYHPTEVVVRQPDMLDAAMKELQGKLLSLIRALADVRSLADAAGDEPRLKAAEVIGQHLDAARAATEGAG